MEFKRPRNSRQRLHSEKIQWPAASNKDILKLFTLSRTHQILSGNSRIFADSNKEGELKDQGPNEARSKFEGTPEIISTKVDVTPKPLEYNDGIVSSDPQKERYEKIQLQRCLHHKKVRKILVNYNLVEAKVDHGLNRRKKHKMRKSKTELKDWKISRAKDTEGWKQKEEYEQNIPSMMYKEDRSNYQKCKTCDCCGDYHFKRVSSGTDQKLNLLVHQINIKTDIIKQHMNNVWDKLEKLEANYTGMLTKTYRLQSSQRVCLEMLSEKTENLVLGHKIKIL